MKKLYCPECSNYLEGGDGECKDCYCGWKQPAGEEKQSTFEQLQEENEKLKQAIIDIYSNCEECEYQGCGTFYTVEQDHVNSAYELTQPTD
ncbi:hypothetical protein QN092_07840 [Proteus vulgaris]|uniref:hypothetical protein n=1 Tax=Proteus vulgaris TaxID=585 RepID=UPI002540D603|nr:hypothetical protein [Proteus vulgaris]WIF73772.1 hypothetical protein QN092_07840 [Proteus vulgaris]